jgi:hypothetical protein
MNEDDPHINGRTPSSIKVNFSLDPDAALLLHQYGPPGRRVTGRFLSRLIFEHHGRQQEWARRAAAPMGCFVDDATNALDDAPGD